MRKVVKAGVSKVRIGLIGCGRVAETRHLPALLSVEGAEVVAAADVDERRLESVAAKFRIARRFSDHRELVACREVDAVAVCTPPLFHTETALDALDAGKHLFVEKPLALSVEECARVIERARTRPQLKAAVGFNLRCHRLVREARKVLVGGGLGEIKLARTVITSGASRAADFPRWRGRGEEGGGALFELGVHHFDLLRFLLGQEVEEVAAAGGEGLETAAVAVRMSSGARATMAFCEAAGESHEVEVYGEHGWMRLSLHRFDGLEIFGANDYAGAPKVRLRGAARTLRELPRMIRSARRGGDYVESYAAQWAHFVEAVRRNAPVGATLEDGKRAVEVALAAVRSSALKRAVRIGETVEEANILEREERAASRF